jgi:DNA-binding FadR family transcriptional regulator
LKKPPATAAAPRRRKPASGFAPLKQVPAYRRVAALIAARIRSRHLPEGEALPTELELAAQLEVTRSTVREALRELESQGLVARRRGTKRMVISRPSAAALSARMSAALALHDVTVSDVGEALLILEPPIAELAARSRTSADLAAMAVASHDFMNSRTLDESLAAVTAFFDAVEAATGNRALLLAQRPLMALLQHSLRLVMHRAPQARTRIAQAQRRIHEAIDHRDGAAAREWMTRHVRDLRRGFEVAGIQLSTRVQVPD